MATPCTPKQCRPNERWDSSSCACIKSGPEKQLKNEPSKIGQITPTTSSKQDSENSKDPYKRLVEERRKRKEREKRENENQRNPKAGISPMKKGGSVTKGSLLRRKASTKGLRTSKKH